MPCGECDRLRKENRELCEELDEYRNMSDGLDPLAFQIKKKLRLRPQAAKVLAIMVHNAGRIVLNRTLIDAGDYEGEANNPDDRRAINSLAVSVTHIRRGLEDVRIFDAVQTFYGQGRMVAKADAERIRALL